MSKEFKIEKIVKHDLKIPENKDIEPEGYWLPKSDIGEIF